MSECTGPDRASGADWHGIHHHNAGVLRDAVDTIKTIPDRMAQAVAEGVAAIERMENAFESASQRIGEFTLRAPYPDVPLDPPRPLWMGTEYKGGGMRSKSTRNTAHRPGGKAAARKAQRKARKKGR